MAHKPILFISLSCGIATYVQPKHGLPLCHSLLTCDTKSPFLRARKCAIYIVLKLAEQNKQGN